MKWILLIVLSAMCFENSYAWSIGQKSSSAGPVIHTTYFLTPNNASFPVRAQAYVGTFLNGVCQYNAIYNIGTDDLKTGDIVNIDANKLMSVVGPNYNCMSIYYTARQLVIETFQLITDGVNYINTFPTQVEVVIL